MGCLLQRPSSDIMIFVQTGDRRNAGTDANVRLVMHDEFGNSSAPITLDNYFRNDLERGCLDTFNVAKSKIRNLPRMGKIARIEIWKDDAWAASDWYVDKIVIENRVTNNTFVFPIFRWIKAKYHYQIRHLDTSLPQFEEYPEQRKMELMEKRKAYVYDQKISNGPVQVKSMPADEQFSFDYKSRPTKFFFDDGGWRQRPPTQCVYATAVLLKHTVDESYTPVSLYYFVWDLVKHKMTMIAVGQLIMWTSDFWDSMVALTNVYTEKIFNIPKGADRWSNDLYFGLQRVASLNHSIITLVTSIPDKLPVTDQSLQPLLEGLSIEEVIRQKRLFICDLQILEGLPVREDFVLCAPIGLFFLDKEQQLRPVAIQLFQKPGPDNPIFTPLCPSLTWALVKMWYNNADAAYHQSLTHLGLTHLLMEGVTVATHRNLSQSHPIFKILAPHFLYLIAINSRGLELLVSDNGWVDKTMNFGNKGLFTLITKGFNWWRMDVQGTLPEDLKDRGLLDTSILPCYHFRNDALLLYEAIKKYADSYVDLYYGSQNLLAEDFEIQNWARELVQPRDQSEGGVGLLGVPGNGQLTSTAQLSQIVTCIIYTCSISHASTNFPQYEEYAFPPNYPALMRGKPPSDVNASMTERDILNCLPDRPTTLDIMIVTKILSAKGTKSLGDFEVQYIFDPQARNIVDEFRRDLSSISKQIKERNLLRNPPYEYLDPDIIPNSISI